MYTMLGRSAGSPEALLKKTGAGNLFDRMDPAEEAFAAAVIFRIATFYIPALEGFFAMKWLQKKGHL